jgi:nitroimidazol reductase NimA-like FMN-containing flavoprotein (pyridoxamine 5'-phosphate oxidase superfamily)
MKRRTPTPKSTRAVEPQAAEPEIAGGTARPGAPVIRELGRAECEALLARSHVGRIAYSFRDRVDITPVHYVADGAWLFGRTSEGAKLDTLRHNQWVAFEVDEVEGLFRWRSVVVHGAFRILGPEGPPADAELWERAIDRLRELLPETATYEDPVAFRTVVFGIHVDAVSGRESTPAEAAGP